MITEKLIMPYYLASQDFMVHGAFFILFLHTYQSWDIIKPTANIKYAFELMMLIHGLCMVLFVTNKFMKSFTNRFEFLRMILQLTKIMSYFLSILKA